MYFNSLLLIISQKNKNANYNYIIGVLTGPKGFSYTLTADNPKQPTWIKMVRNDDPEIYFTVYKEQIARPFDN